MSIPIRTERYEKYRADTYRPLIAASGKTLRLEGLRSGYYPGNEMPTESLAGVKAVGFWDAQRDQPWGLRWHRDEGIEITFLETGHLRFGSDQREYDLQAGDLTITRAWKLHRIGCPQVTASRLHWLVVDFGADQPRQWPSWMLLTPADMEDLARGLRLNERPVWKANTEIRRCFRAISQAVEMDRNGSNIQRLKLRLNDLFVLLLDMLRSKPVELDRPLPATQRSVQRFLEDLRAHPQDLGREWSVEDMARSCGLGVSQFSHYVKCLVNMSPMHYLCQCRIDRAAELLKTTPEVSITDTALELGFSSSQYFATVFRRRFGYSPRSLRPSGAHRLNTAGETAEQNTQFRERQSDPPRFDRSDSMAAGGPGPVKGL
jgi:AraC-like DNA-binding protein